VCARVERKKLVDDKLLINVTCVSASDDQRSSKLSVWIHWQLPPPPPPPAGETAQQQQQHWHSFIEVLNDRRSHLDYIAETNADHKRLDLPADQLYSVRVSPDRRAA